MHQNGTTSLGNIYRIVVPVANSLPGAAGSSSEDPIGYVIGSPSAVRLLPGDTVDHNHTGRINQGSSE